MSEPTAFPLDESKLPFKIPKDTKPREKIMKLGQMITDRVPAKLRRLTVEDPEYWGLASIVTDEMADVALKMKVRQPMTLPELEKATGKPAKELELLLYQMSCVGLLEYNWENPRREKQYILPMFVPGSAEFFNMNKQQIADHPEVTAFFERMTFLPLEHITAMVPPGGAGIGMHVIPVEKAIETENHSLDIEHISHWLKKYQGKYAAGPCSCRMSRAAMGEGCGDDPDDWCIGVGDMADYLVETNKGHYVTYDEVMRILQKAEDNGFVHQITNIDGENKIFAICNCNVNVCNALRTSQLFNTPNMSRSAYVANEYSNTDWVNEIFKKHALQTSHSVSVRGGSEKSSYFMSYGYLDQDGLVVGDAFKTKRHNARINVNTEVFDRLKINGNVSFVDYYRNASGFSGTGGVFRLAQRMSPLLPVKWQQQNEMGLWEDTEYWSSGSINNPVYVAKEGGEEKRKSRTLNTIVSADLRIIDGLNLGGQYAANYYFRETDKFTPTLPEYFSDGTPDPANKNMRNSVSQAHQDALTQTLQLTLNFQKQINKHEIGALLGYSQEWYNFSSLSASRKKIPFDGIYVIDAGTEDITNSGTKSSWALRSYFGRVNYAFDGKYLVEANMRIDGTSRFARDNRWGYFPSFSAGWNFSREEFMQFAEPVLSSGKLRASWGELGNQNVGSDYYPYLTPIDSGESYPIGGKQNIGFQQSKLGNANIKWETIRMLNVGVDLTFFNNRLTASFDWFKKDNIDALVKPVYPTVVGITGTANLPYENMGKIENKGWELEIGWRDQIGEVKYNLLFNLSDAKNKIVDLGTSEPRLTNNIRREGDPIDAYYGYLTDGLAQIDDFGGVDSNGKYINPKFAIPKAAEAITQPGDIKYRDISGPGGIPDGEIDEYDKVVFGDPYPHYSYSLRGQLQWRDWDFSFYFQGVGKVNGYLSDEARHCFINDYSIPKVEHLDRWTPNNPDATYPRLYQAQSHNLLFSDYWKEDASYLRLKNVQLGYSIPKKLLNRWKIEGLRLYASADNLLTFTKYFGAYDPEVRESSGDVYPQVKTYVFGLVLSF